MALLPKDIIRLVQVMNIQFLCHLSTAASSGISFAGDAILPNVPRDVYAMPGDINIGLTMDIHEHADKSGCVGDIRPGSWAIEYPEAVAFAVDMVNKNPKLIPRATLGFYLLDDCADRRYVMAHGLTFLPRNNLICIPALCHDSVCDRNICGISSWPYIPSLSKAYTEQPVPHYDVIGILAPPLSKLTISLSNLLSLSKIPIIGFLASTDELSDKTLHPHFLRVVTADKYQALAMLTFISANGWSFISVVYAKDPYGEGAFETILDSVGSFNICIATSHRVTSDNDMNSVAKDLLNYPRARVVILFIYDNMAINLFESIETFNATGHFIWICCDAVSRAGKKVLSQYMDNVVGAFFLGYDTVSVPEFYEHIRRQNPTMSPNPWFKHAWENTFKCSFGNSTCNTTADITGSTQFGYEDQPSLAMDAVLAFAHGIHNLLSDLCPNASGKAARDCIKRDTLLQYLGKVSFKGFTGHIEFDNNYDYCGEVMIYQMVYDYLSVHDNHGKLKLTNSKGLVSKTVAVYDSSLSLLTYTDEGIRWDHLLKTERVVPLTSNTSIPEVPESVCSRPCVPPEYMIKKKFDCCWDCQPCLSNEKLINGKTGCEVCEKFTWPDPETGFTTCRDIPLTYVSYTHTFPVLAICLAIIGIITTLLIAAIFICQREKPVIKSGSRELNAFQLSGILVGYATVIPFQTTPTPVMCTVLYVMFWLSFAWLYSSLLIDVFRIYRVFQNVMKGVTLHCVSPMSLTIMSSVIILSQVFLCLLICILFHPTAIKTQHVPTEKFVELSCDMTLPGLISFLAYNLVLIILCAAFSFKTRRLPNDFRESKFIFMCMYTTLVIWLAFIPTYFTANREYVKVLLLSTSLLLNHTVALMFLFVHKIYLLIHGPAKSLGAAKSQPVLTGVETTRLSHSALPMLASGVWIGPDVYGSSSRVALKSAMDIRMNTATRAAREIYRALFSSRQSSVNSSEHSGEQTAKEEAPKRSQQALSKAEGPSVHGHQHKDSSLATVDETEI